MNDYQKLITSEAKAFYDSARAEFEEDSAEFGGESDKPNLQMWIDRKETLSGRVQDIAGKWTHKDVLWVQHNTKNRDERGGGDPRSSAFASFLKDVRREIKKLAKGKG